jgi:hypothetical protein
MASQQLHAIDSSGLHFPAFVTEPLNCVESESDDVHRFIRLIAFAEGAVKFLAACAHAALSGQDVPLRDGYVQKFRTRFIDKDDLGKYPSLGDWKELLQDAMTGLGNSAPQWLRDVRAFADQEFRASTEIYNFCAQIDRLKRPNAEVPLFYKGWEFLGKITTLRNHYSHGALTGGFARRINPSLCLALQTFATESMKQPVQVVWTKRYPPRERQKVEIVDAATHRTRSIDAEDLVTEVTFFDVYVGPRDCTAIGKFNRIGGLYLYDYDSRDVYVFNGREKRLIRYLSYRSGSVISVEYAEADLDARFCVDEVESGGQPAAPDDSPQMHVDAPKTASGSKAATQLPAMTDGGSGSEEPSAAEPLTRVDHSERLRQRFESLASGPRISTGFPRLLSYWEEDLVRSLSLSQQREFLDSAWSLLTRLPRAPESHAHFVGSLAQRLGMVDIAVTVFRDMLERDPGNKELMSRLGNALLVQGREQRESGERELSRESFTEAKTILLSALPEGPLSDFERRLAARTFSCAVSAASRLGDHQEAIEIARRGLAACPGDHQLESQLQYHLEREPRRRDD